MRERRRHRLVFVLGLLIVAGCAQPHSAGTSPVSAAAIDNGQSIFQTGRDIGGRQIVARTPPLLRSCAACHRADGSGGIPFAGGVVSADLRHDALVTKQAKPYTVALLERAISTGIDNTGAPLNALMPHWQLSRTDLHDVAAYVARGFK